MNSVTKSTAGPNPNPDNPNKRHSSNTLSQNICERKPKSAIGTAISLGEDELSLILRNVCLTTWDLLNFRLVNKIWRDVATSTLLLRDACFVDLRNEITEVENDARQKIRISPENYFKQGFQKGTLSQLTDVMSNSPKFPASCLRVWAYNLETGPNSEIDYLTHPGLHKFFQLHGAKFKTFYHVGSITLEPFVANLSSYAPNIECLNLQDASIFHSQQQIIGSNENISELTSKCNSVKSLTLGSEFHYRERHIIHRLLSSFPNLSSIKNVQMETLPLILNEGKGHLIRSFECRNLDDKTEMRVPLVQEFTQLNPKLSRLKLELWDLSCFEISDCISALFEVSKGSLQELELPFKLKKYEIKLRLCTMKQLRCLILSELYSYSCRGPANDNEEGTYFVFENGMSAQECFPSLVKLCLHGVNVKKVILQFFQFKLTETGITGTPKLKQNCLPNVQVLEIDDSSVLKNSDSSLILQFLPNFRVLKITCEEFQQMSSSFWLQVSWVEFLEICIKPSGHELEGNVSFFSDIFFTGFSPEMCFKLRTTELPESFNNAQGLKFLRVSPSVCDLLHLKELKLKVSSRLWAELASHVTGIYAFSQMPNTRFILSYSPRAFKWKRNSLDDGIDHAEMCFGSIKPYVQIVHE